MSIDTVLLFAPAETTASDHGPAAYAISLAKAHGAKLTLFVVDLDVTTPGRSTDSAAVATAIGNAARAADVGFQVITEHTHAIGIHEVVAEHARLHDRTVAGCSGEGLLNERMVVEHLLFDSGRPILLVPDRHDGVFSSATTVIAWDNSRAASRALGDAKPLVGRGELIFLAIDGDKHVTGDFSPEEVVGAARQRNFVASYATAARGNRSIADALQDEAHALGAGLLVMGGYAHSRLRRFVLGSATAGIIAGPRLPVLLSH